MRPRDREHGDEAERHGERDAPRCDLGGQPSGGRGTDEPRQDDHAQRARDQHEPEVDAVGREEAVRLYAVPKLARENDAEHRSRTTDRCRGDPRQKPAPNGPLTH